MTEIGIAIIGAGIAGLSAAAALVKKNYENFVILEAREVIGGRVGVTYPKGPSFLHGICGNPLAYTAKSVGLKTYPDCWHEEYAQSSIVCRSSSGKNVSDAFREAYAELDIAMNDVLHLHNGIDTIAFNHPAFYDQIPDSNFRDSLKSCGWTADTNVRMAVESLMLDVSSGAPANTWSTKAYLASDSVFSQDPQPRNPFLLAPDGFLQCIKHISASIPHERIKTGCEVSSIDYSDKKRITLTLKSGETFVAEKVIVTIPCHLISEINWSPSLPDRFSQVFSQISYANYCRVVVECSEVFWDDVAVIIRAQDPESDTRPFSDSLDHPGRSLTYWQNMHFLSRIDSQSSNPSKVLISHVSGFWADELCKMSSVELKSYVERLLAQMYPSRVVQVTEAHILSWKDDPFARGSFAVCKPGVTSSTVQQLAQPIDGRIYFAGDAYDLLSIGTTQCAFKTGRNAALDILASHL